MLARRFCGPPDSANGGYAAGTLARYVDGPAEVTLRRPPPLERPLAIERDADRVLLLDGADLVAEAIPTVLDIAPVEPVDFNAAVAASESSRFLDANAHPFPSCFVCGPLRAPGDGLRVFAGQVPGTDRYAAPWIPPDDDERMAWLRSIVPPAHPFPSPTSIPSLCSVGLPYGSTVGPRPATRTSS
jgi:hypothetical protein